MREGKKKLLKVKEKGKITLKISHRKVAYMDY